MEHCPCDSGLNYHSCCQPIVERDKEALTAEALMRSRYTAFVLENAPYLLHSWHPSHRPQQLSFDPDQRWLGLKIKRTSEGGQEDETGTVEFVARYKIHGRGNRIHELSRFCRHQGRWCYLDGDQLK